MRKYLLYLYAESPVHAGGAEADGVVDLPIQREASTGYPVIWGQSLKGALRQAARDAGWHKTGKAEKGALTLLEEVFGKMAAGDDEPGRNTSAGLLSVGDAQLVALPVPTLRNGFAWATSPLALGRLSRKHVYAETGRELPEVPEVRHEGGLCVTQEWEDRGQVVGPCLVHTSYPQGNESHPLARWAELIAAEGIGLEPHLAVSKGKFEKDLLMVGEVVMSQLLRECTEQSVRVQLEPDHKVVKHGPFTSEYLPTETLLVSALVLREGYDREAEHHEALHELLHGSVLQIGGDQTLGKGLMWARLVETVDE